MPLNSRVQWNAGTACVSECVLKTLACRGLRVGPSKYGKKHKQSTQKVPDNPVKILFMCFFLQCFVGSQNHTFLLGGRFGYVLSFPSVQ